MKTYTAKAIYRRTGAGSYVCLAPGRGNLPNEIWVEQVKSRTITRAGYCLTYRAKGFRKFLTGLLGVPFLYWYSGDKIEWKGSAKAYSLLLVCFSADLASMTIYLYDGFYLRGKQLHAFIAQQIKKELVSSLKS